jgi:integrase
VIDFARRKRGRIRREIPLWGALADLLESYRQAQITDGVPVGDNDFIFCDPFGQCLKRFTDGGPQNWVTRHFTTLQVHAGIRAGGKWTTVDERERFISKGCVYRRGFCGLRTTFANSIPNGFTEAGKQIMGHARGTTFDESYRETRGRVESIFVVNAMHELFPIASAWPNPGSKKGSRSAAVRAASSR